MFPSCSPLDSPEHKHGGYCPSARRPGVQKAHHGGWAFHSIIVATRELFLVLERVADGHAEACCPRAAEFEIVVDQIKMGFRTDEHLLRNIQAHGAAKLPEKMIAAHKVCAAYEIALEGRCVKAEAFRADSGR